MFKFRSLVTLLVLMLFLVLESSAQNWIPGFRYRRLITFDKSKIPDNGGFSTYLDFTVLVEVELPDFIRKEQAFEQKLLHPLGQDISFALSTSASVPVRFQLDHYNATTGKLSCWVQVPNLYSQRSTFASTSVYFYYNSQSVHDPNSAATRALWENQYSEVNHLQGEQEGKIQGATFFNGIDTRIRGNVNRSVSPTTISAWVKLNRTDREQIIVTNDSAAVGGFQAKVNAEGKPAFTGFSGTRASWTYTSTTVLLPDRWYHLAFFVESGNVSIRINGASTGVLNSSYVLGPGGQLSIGASKQNGHFLDGLIDELRIAKVTRTSAWLSLEYAMQNAPAAFHTIGEEQLNPAMTPIGFTFIGSKSSLWNVKENWANNTVPVGSQVIRVASGKTLDVPSDIVMNKLLLEGQAKINVLGKLRVSGVLELWAGSQLVGREGAHLQLESSVENNGLVDFSAAQAILEATGTQDQIRIYGGGRMLVEALVVNRPVISDVNIQSDLDIKGILQVVSGKVNSNGRLTLLADAQRSARVLSMPRQVVFGDVHVQYYIAGSFPSPSSGRGWRLLSSPVYQEDVFGRYHLKSLQKSVFVTGKGGPANGFDASPNNGPTIYTHDQSLPGTLAQKYVPIPTLSNMQRSGTGFFLFSRGDRSLPDAYTRQITQPPFMNAPAYVITYTGTLFNGDVRVTVSRSNRPEAGDGFNLLGNPYASPIRWGSLEKQNLSPFIWLFDPVNNSYRSTDDPEEIIPMGTGFFVRVVEGEASGSVLFTENAKVAP